MTRRRSVVAGVSAVVLLCASVASAAPRRVLLLYSYDREFAGHAFAALFRPELARVSADPIDFIEASIQAVPSATADAGRSTLDELRATFGSAGLDLVVPIGGPAATFAQTYRDQLFP